MGWYGDYRTPTEVREEVTRDINPAFRIVETASTVYGKHLWVLYEEKATSQRFIELFLIEGSRGSYAYKPMSEDAGPCYYDCPLSLLDKAGPDDVCSEYAKEWRASVREYHAKKKQARETAKTLVKGDRVKVFGKEYTVWAREGRRFFVVRDGRIFRASPENIERVTA